MQSHKRASMANHADELPPLLDKWLTNTRWWGWYRMAWIRATERAEDGENQADEDNLFAAFADGSLVERADAALVRWLQVDTGYTEAPEKRKRDSPWHVDRYGSLEHSMVYARLIKHVRPKALELAEARVDTDHDYDGGNENAAERWKARVGHLRNACDEDWDWVTAQDFMRMREEAGHEEPPPRVGK